MPSHLHPQQHIPAGLLPRLRACLRRRHAAVAAPPDRSRLADTLAPNAVRVAGDHAVVDDLYAGTVVLADPPAAVPANWLGEVVAQVEPCDIALHVAPQNAAEATRHLRSQLAELEGARRAAEVEGLLPDPARAEAIEQIAGLRRRIENREAVFTVGFYVTAYAPSRRALDDRLGAVEKALHRYQAMTRRPVLQVMEAFRSTLPAAQDILGDGFPVDGHSLSSMSLFDAPTLQMEGGIWYGVNRLTGEFVTVDPFFEGFDNFNSCVIGKSGGGKGVTLKERALRSLPLGVHHTVLDPANEYIALAEAVGGQVVYLSPGSRERINPLDLPAPHRGQVDADAGDLLANHIEAVQGLLALLLAGKSEFLSETEKGVLDAALAQTYAAAGITEDPATHDRPAPTLADLKRVLDAMDDEFHLGLRLARYCTGALRGLFGGTTTVTTTNPLTVFAMRDLSEDLWPAAMYLVSQHTWRQAYAGDGIRRCITVDECHRIFDEPSGEGNRLLGRLIREGRKYLLGVETATQDPGDYLLTSGGRASVVNANTVILLKQNEGSLAALRQVIELSAPEEAYLKGCEKGQGLLIAQDPEHPGEKKRIPLRVMMSPAHEPYVRRDGFLAPPSA